MLCVFICLEHMYMDISSHVEYRCNNVRSIHLNFTNQIVLATTCKCTCMALSAAQNKMNIGCLVSTCSPLICTLCLYSLFIYRITLTANMLPSFGKDDSGQYSEDSPSDNEVAEIMQVHRNIYIWQRVY